MSGPGSIPRRHVGLAALAGAALALGPAAFLWGFSVDDALITARYAANIADGFGYRFNASGPVTDGVTPLGFPYVLAPFAAGGPLAALRAAKVLGIVAWVVAAGALGAAIARSSDKPARFGALALIAASAPLGAWSGAGMETGVALALGGLAAALPELGYGRAGALCAGACAALRPEMLPWAVVLGAASTFAPSKDASRAASWREGAVRVAMAAAPFALAALVRWSIFGRPAPLSILAKAPDVELGAKYALACFLLTGPVALVAPLAFPKLNAWPRGLLLATAAHFIAIALAGGDWMPLSRLAVPVLPAAALGAAHIASVAPPLVTAARLAVALAGEIFVFVRMGPVSASVMESRLAVIDELRGSLQAPETRVVAALDIGWLGASTDATIVDLAGVTDPAIAALPGGHTTKQIPLALIEARNVDTLVLLLAEDAPLKSPWTESRFARGVEQRIAFFPGIAEDFSPVAESGLGEGNRKNLRYVVLKRVSSRTALLRDPAAPSGR
jgi:hypothetical protein